MEEEQGSYQAEEQVSTETQPEAAETVTTQEEVAPKGFTVKYNKEEKFVSEDEAPTWIQKGLNYDKVNERAQQLEAQTKYLEKRAKQEGFADVDSYVRAIDELEQQKQIQEEADRMNVDPDIYAQHLQPLSKENQELRNKLQGYEQTAQQQQQQQLTNQRWEELGKEYPSLGNVFKEFENGNVPAWYTPQMKAMVEQFGYHPKHAYELAHKDTLFKAREQETLAKVLGRDERQVLPTKDSPNNMQFNPANMTAEERKELSRRAQNGERITF